MIRRSLARGALVAFAYGSLAGLFVLFYSVRTVWLAPWGMAGFTRGTAPFPFRYRFLVPYLVRQAQERAHLPPAWGYAALATVAVAAALFAYRKLLARYAPEPAATILAPGLLYALAWNYCALNLLYFPFDLPAVAFFTAGWWLVLERRWWAYYPLFAVALLNRETGVFLTVVTALVWFRRMAAPRLLAHVSAQALVWVGVRWALTRAFPGAEAHWVSDYGAAKNHDTLVHMATGQGTAVKDWAKLFLAFGSTWIAAPFLYRRQPEAVRRSLWVVFPYVGVMLFAATIDEMRVYAELVPILTTPVVLALARGLAPPTRGAPAASAGSGS